MPELPEVETMRRGILSVVGRRITAIRWAGAAYRPIRIEPSRAHFRKRTIGQRIERVDRRGKRVLLALGNTLQVVIEPRMTGLILLANAPDEDHLRVGFQLDDCEDEWLWFWDRRGLGGVACWTEAELAERLGPDQLGPDALDIACEVLHRQLASARRPIKVALLDQQRVAGIGNLYASEILHVAGLDPALPCDQLETADWERLHAAIRDVLQTAIHYEGSTLSDGTYRNALNQQGSYQNHHRVYDRANEVCPSCRDASIVRVVQAQRSTFFCPRCQPRRTVTSTR